MVGVCADSTHNVNLPFKLSLYMIWTVEKKGWETLVGLSGKIGPTAEKLLFFSFFWKKNHFREEPWSSSNNIEYEIIIALP